MACEGTPSGVVYFEIIHNVSSYLACKLRIGYKILDFLLLLFIINVYIHARVYFLCDFSLI